jgi:peptidoglycan/LPS O-acetylase OafA/YrhL
MLYIAQYFGINILPIRLINSILAISIIMRVTEERYSKAEAFILNSKVLSSLGKVSYGIYLFHYTVPFHYADLLRFFDITNISTTHLLYVPIVAELIQFAMLILISYASFYLFEMQFLRFKGLFKYQLKLTTTLKD